MTHEDVKQLLGPVDDSIIVEILRTGATSAQLGEALAWIECDDALMKARRPAPSGMVAQLVEILTADDDEADDRSMASDAA